MISGLDEGYFSDLKPEEIPDDAISDVEDTELTGTTLEDEGKKNDVIDDSAAKA